MQQNCYIENQRNIFIYDDDFQFTQITPKIKISGEILNGTLAFYNSKDELLGEYTTQQQISEELIFEENIRIESVDGYFRPSMIIVDKGLTLTMNIIRVSLMYPNTDEIKINGKLILNTPYALEVRGNIDINGIGEIESNNNMVIESITVLNVSPSFHINSLSISNPGYTKIESFEISLNNNILSVNKNLKIEAMTKTIIVNIRKLKNNLTTSATLSPKFTAGQTNYTITLSNDPLELKHEW